VRVDTSCLDEQQQRAVCCVLHRWCEAFGGIDELPEAMQEFSVQLVADAVPYARGPRPTSAEKDALIRQTLTKWLLLGVIKRHGENALLSWKAAFPNHRQRGVGLWQDSFIRGPVVSSFGVWTLPCSCIGEAPVAGSPTWKAGTSFVVSTCRGTALKGVCLKPEAQHGNVFSSCDRCRKWQHRGLPDLCDKERFPERRLAHTRAVFLDCKETGVPRPAYPFLG